MTETIIITTFVLFLTAIINGDNFGTDDRQSHDYLFSGYGAQALQVFEGKQVGMTKHILVTNDDSVSAPRLFALVQEMRKFGKVTVMALDRNWSGGGHVKTLTGYYASRKLDSPTQARPMPAMARHQIVSSWRHLGFSRNQSIWCGANLGQDVTYSGSVTAAIEAVIAGIPSVAVSGSRSKDTCRRRELRSHSQGCISRSHRSQHLAMGGTSL